MAASNFRRSLALVLAHEGGYSNHPADPGGATNFGITQVVYDAYRRYNRCAVQGVKQISTTEVSEIYAKNYWNLIRGDSLPIGLDYAVFDFAVNSGVSRAVRYLQRAVSVADDGALGMLSMAAIETVYSHDKELLITKYCANRLAFMESLKTFSTFGKGWTRRVIGMKPGAQDSDSGVLDYAINMAKKLDVILLPKPSELKAKAIGELTTESFVTNPAIITCAADLKQLANG